MPCPPMIRRSLLMAVRTDSALAARRSPRSARSLSSLRDDARSRSMASSSSTIRPCSAFRAVPRCMTASAE